MFEDNLENKLEENAELSEELSEEVSDVIEEEIEQKNEKITEKSADGKKIMGRVVRKMVIGVVLAAMAVFVMINAYGFVEGFLKPDNAVPEDMPVVYVKNKSDIMTESKNKKEVYKITDLQGGAYSSTLVQYVKGNKIVFYADDNSGGEFKLYYRKTDGKDTNGKGIKIANGVNSFLASPDGEFVLYRKGDRLFYSNMKKETSIAKDVSYYWLSDDLNKILLKKTDGELSVCEAELKHTLNKIDINVSSVVYYDEGMKEIYYIKDDGLYKKDGKKDSALIAEGIMGAEMIDNKLFYSKVNDDMTYDLYTVKGDKTEKLAGNMMNVNFYTQTLTRTDGNNVLYYIFKSDGTVINADITDTKVGPMKLSEDEKYFYCIEEIEDGKGILNRYEILRSGMGEKEEIAGNVSSFELKDDCVIAMASGYLGIYDDGEFVELSSTSNEYEFIDGTVYYFDNYDIKNSGGDLFRYENGKKEAIDVNVRNILVRDKNDCYFIKNFDSKTQSGELYRKNSRKPKKIDTEVNYIIK